jgi:hypothetical protein
MRRHKPPLHFVRPEHLDWIESITDPDRRAVACCALNVIGDTPRTRAILKSCSAASEFYRELVTYRRTLTTLPVRKFKRSKRKPWTAPFRVPSLFPKEPNEMGPAVVAPSQPATPESGVEQYEPLWAKSIAEATLSNFSLLDTPPDPDEAAKFLHLLIGFTEDKQNALVEYRKAHPAPSIVFSPAGNLFSAFGIEVPANPYQYVADDTPLRRRRRKSWRPASFNLFKIGGES